MVCGLPPGVAVIGQGDGPQPIVPRPYCERPRQRSRHRAVVRGARRADPGLATCRQLD
jgi:hypothetical protein